MDAVTYPHTSVADHLSRNVVALRVKFDDAILSRSFRVNWTPTLVMVDPEGTEHQRSVGFLPPEELVPWLLLGSAKWHFDAGRPDRSIPELEEIIQSYGKSDAAAEATYLLGVCRYKTTQDPKPLKEAYEKLKAAYPGSEWEKRAQPYRLL